MSVISNILNFFRKKRNQKIEWIGKFEYIFDYGLESKFTIYRTVRSSTMPITMNINGFWKNVPIESTETRYYLQEEKDNRFLLHEFTHTNAFSMLTRDSLDDYFQNKYELIINKNIFFARYNGHVSLMKLEIGKDDIRENKLNQVLS